LEDVDPVADASTSSKDQAYDGECRRVTCNNPLFFCEPGDGHHGSSAAAPGKGEHGSNRCDSGELKAHDLHQQCNMAKVREAGMGGLGCKLELADMLRIREPVVAFQISASSKLVICMSNNCAIRIGACRNPRFVSLHILHDGHSSR
jgi:hypothetical protein